MKILRRFRLQLFWLNLPSTLLITLLQRTPALKLAAVADEMVIASPLGAVLRSALAATASLGVMHTLAGATELAPSQPSPASGTVGTPLTIAFSITGTTSGPESWTVGGAVPPGMGFSGLSSETLVLSGTPTTAGSYTMSIQAEDGPTGFQTPSFSYTVNISGGVTAVAPSITSHPASQTVTEGAGVTFNAAADGTPAPTLQWQFNGSPIGGATGTSYSIGSVNAGNAGTYTVVATNSAGSVTSNGATLTVNPATVAPSISAHPSGQTVNAGANVSFSVSASGTPSPSYQWRKDGADIGGANSSTLDIFNVQVGNAGTYTVLVSNSAGSVLSNGAVLAINVAPAITAHPSAQIVNESQSAQFSVSASGIPSPSYQWQRLPAGSGTWANLANGGNYSGVTTTTLTVSGATMAMSGDQFRGVASNSVGSATSNAAALTVNARVPTIVSASPDQTIAPGASVGLTVVPGGTAPFTYQWKLNGNDLGGANSATLNLANFQSANAGTYALLVTNAAGTATATIILTLLTPPVITSHPANVSADLGSNTSFTVVASSTFAPGYQWQRQPAGGGGFSNVANGGVYSGATLATLSITGLTAGMDGDMFQCIVTNAAGSVTSNAALLDVIIPAPVITTQPASQSAVTGIAVTFTVISTSPVAQTHQWRKDGVDIDGATLSSLTIPSFQLADAGSYTVTVTNSGGSVTSNAAILAVAVPPTITTQPQAQTVYSGTEATFSVTATSNAPMSYQWRKDGTVIPEATQSTFIIPVAQLSDAGDYSVVVTNMAGNDTSTPATLTVNPSVAPVITQHPQSKTVAWSAPTSFSVTATGTPAPSYRWQRLPAGSGTWADVDPGVNLAYGGVNQPTLFLYVGTLNDNHGDQFRCVVSNPAGTVVSNPATLLISTSIAPVAATGGYSFGQYLDGNGVLHAMGRNQEGQLGDGTATPHLLPSPVATQVVASDAGSDHGLFLKLDGTLWSKGFNESGAIGDGSAESKYTAVQIASQVAAAAAGHRHSLFRKTDGTLWAAGWNLYGQLGDGTAVNRLSPVQVATHVVDMDAGYFHSVYVRGDGTVWAMGYNGLGQFGDGTTANSLVPIQVGSATRTVAAGTYHTLFLKTDGTLWGAGYNTSGQLGDGTNLQRTTAVQVASQVTAIAAGFAHSLFLKADGTLWAMGANDRGQLGDGTIVNRAGPIQIASGVTSIAAGLLHSYYVRADGTLWASGANDQGQLGDGGITDRSTPIQIASGALGLPREFTQPTASSSPISDRVTLSWNPSRGAAYYEIGRSTTNDSATASVIATRVNGTYHEDLTGVSGQTYYYWVRAVGGEGTLGFGSGAAGTYGSAAIAPTITNQPQNQSVSVGGSVSFEVTASGTAPIGYQWRKGANPISGATAAIFTIASATMGDAGDYDVVVSNAAGTVISGTGTLAITGQAQTINFTGPSDQGFSSAPIALSATASSGLTVSFSLVSGPADLSGNQLSLTGVGTVTVRASQAGDASYEAAPDVDRTFTVSANFDSWALGYFSAPELADANVSGPNADPDGDGYANLVEYALGLEPRSPGTGGLPEVSADATHWLLTYLRPIDRADATCTVEYSTTLTSWTAIPPNDHVLVSTDAGIETWQAKYPLASAPNIFYRLKVSR